MTGIRKIIMGIGFSLVLTIIDVSPSVASASQTASMNAYVMRAMVPIKPIVLLQFSKSNQVGAILPVGLGPG